MVSKTQIPIIGGMENAEVKEELQQAEPEKKKRIPPWEKPDFRYRGPLSYRGLRILGWVFFAVSRLAIIFSVAGKLEIFKGNGEIVSSIFDICGSMMMPLFLLANISIILRNRKALPRLLIFHAGMALGIALLYYFVTERYLVTFLDVGRENRGESREVMMLLFNSLFSRGINVFLDLFLCTSFAFFLSYTPKKIFTGKKLIIFRLMMILPIAYELFFCVYKVMLAANLTVEPEPLVPWVPTKSISIFIAFALIALIMKFHDGKLTKTEIPVEQIASYEQSNRNSLRTSIAISTIFGIVGILDFIIFIGVFIITSYVQNFDEAAALKFGTSLPLYGFGQGTSLILVIPFILLFSYTREHKNKEIDHFIPVGGMLLVLITYLEGFLYIFTHI